jgi:hypothetical protein
VVLAAVKAVFLHMKNVNPELSKNYLKKMAPPLGMYSGRDEPIYFANL